MGTLHPLAAYRESRKLTQAQLGKLLRVDRQTIHRWESGKRKPGIDVVPKISAKTGIPPRQLRPDLVSILGAKR